MGRRRTSKARGTRRARKGSGPLALLVVLLALLGGYGTWNYQKSIEAENAEVRPYRSYSDAELAALEDAYRAEVQALDERYAAVRDRKQTVQDRGFGQAQVEEFERVQRASRSVRELGARVSVEQATLDEIVKERQRRLGMASGWKRILQRAFQISV